ncbi:hypothetical protein OEZ60_07435 [Defluviimonas sp. WL0024]|uniref:DUF4239 domain-containing protein n=1 Tax=Albidovulum salinarum TaxID=2984153 RepID=A0ABT2X1N3_9RHOB|nr:hypothetical protein [Defluviimonas sp. WL0024]MCU9847836.1 hypothetical protein [Defluviimonas sp. WL0024]
MGNETGELYTRLGEPLLPFPYLVAMILVSLPLAALVGYRFGHVEYGRRQYDKVPPEQVPGATSLGAMLALVGLLLGFAFSSVLNWREARQTALVEEAAAISSAFLGADLLKDPGRTDLQTQILAYAQTRLASNDDLRTREAFGAFLERTLEAQAEIWPATMRAMSDATSDPVRTLVARGVMDMLDSHTRRIAAAAEQVPPPAQLMIFLAALAAIMIVGNRSALQGRPQTWRTFAFAGLLAVVMIMILDLDRMHEGTMRLNPDTMLATIHDMETALAALAR